MAKMKTVQSLDAEIAELQETRAKLLKAERAGVISKIQEAVTFYGIKPEEITFTPSVVTPMRRATDRPRVAERGQKARDALKAAQAKKTNPLAGRKVPLKYQDPDVPADSWTGRGVMPNWLKARLSGGAKLEEFLIDKEQAA